MSNTINTSPTIRWQLLSTVSVFALLASTYGANATGNDSDRPLIWIELGGQMENVSGQGEAFDPAFLAANSSSSVIWSGVTPLEAQKPPAFSFGEEGKISFQPQGSDWVFSAAARIGRSGAFRHVHHQTDGTFYQYYISGKPHATSIHATEDSADTKTHHKEDHTILDFSVGKDVGFGLFGRDSTSTLSAGVRFAQFTSKATFDIRARPDLGFKYATFPSFNALIKLPHFHTYYATGQAARSFDGVGPSLSWSNSMLFAGNAQDGELALDWGVNASILFGKQKTRVRHQTSQHYASPFFNFNGNYFQTSQPAIPHNRNSVRSVTVPNVGGSVGLSWQVQDFKVSMGYRADFFFGAMDTGIDAVKKSDLAFKGPYASISVGLGD